MRRARARADAPDANGYSPLVGPLIHDGLLRRSWPFALAGIAAVGMLAFPDTHVTDTPALYAAGAATLVLLLTVHFAPWARIPIGIQATVPIGFLGVIALFREATGGTAGFAILVMLPVLWLALYGTRWQLVLSIICGGLVFVVPIVVIGAPVYPASQLGRIMLWPITAAIIGGTTYRLVAAERARAAFVGGLLSAATQQSIIATDPDGLITVFNTGAERMYGYSAAEMVGRQTPLILHDPEEVQARAAELGVEPGFEVFSARARVGEADTQEWTYVARDGQRLAISLSVTPVLDATGSLRGFIKVGTDVTERVAAEQMKDAFVAAVSHELRTPLSSIIGYLEVIFDEEESGPLTERQRRFLAIVDRNARRQLRLVSDLLFVSQVEAGRVRLDVAEVDLAEIARGAVEISEPRARAAQVALRLSADRPVRIRGDADRLGQVLDNLLTNAVKFTPASGTVEVRVTPTPTGGRIEVSDNGIGIPAAEQERLFQRFFRASTATSRAIPGVGLGLTILKAIVAEHGGTVTLTSAEGAGTSFVVELPGGLGLG